MTLLHGRRGRRLGMFVVAVSVVASAAITFGASGSTSFAGPRIAAKRAAAATGASLFDVNELPAVAAAFDSRSIDLGVRFAPLVDGYVTGIRFYKGAGNDGRHTGTVWTDAGKAIGNAVFRNETPSGWQTAVLAKPILLSANTTYVVSYLAPHGHYAYTRGYFNLGHVTGNLLLPAASASRGNGLYKYRAGRGFPTDSANAANYWVDVAFSALPPMTVPPPPISGFPNASNTGVPAGTALSTYAGPLTITTCGTVIDSKIVTNDLEIKIGNGFHDADHPCVTITNSIIHGAVYTHYAEWSCPLDGGGRGTCGPLVMRDSEIAMPIPNSGNAMALGQTNYFVWRVNEHGGRTAMDCDGWCEIHDSYLHDNYYVKPQHMGSFHSSGASGRPVWLDHSTLLCNVANPANYHGDGGCSADVVPTGDFSAIQNMTFTNNLFLANPGLQWYSAYTGVSQPGKPFPVGSNITFSGNTWQLCASAPAKGGCLRKPTTTSGDLVIPDWNTAVAAKHHDRWCDNRFDDGTLVAPAFETNNC